MASLTEAAKAVLEGKNLEEGYGSNPYPSVGKGGTSNPDPVDPSTASTGNAKTLRPGSKSVDGRHSNPGAADPASLSGIQDLGGQTPTQVPTENLGAKASGGKKRDTSVKGSGANQEPPKKVAAMAEEMEDESEVFEEETYSLAERLKALKEARKSKACDMDEEALEEDEELELSEELEDFINEAIEAGLDEEEILEAIDENFEFISEEEQIDELSDDLAYRAMKNAAAKAREIGSPEASKSEISGRAAGEYKRQADKFREYGNKKFKQSLVDRDKSKLSGAKKRRLGLDEDYEDLSEELENYEVDMSEHVEALLAGEDLSEEFHAKATTIFEAAVKAKLEEEVALLEQAYAETLEERVNEIMEELASNVDDYLNYVVEQWIEENEVAVESALRSELTEDFISGLRSLFAEHYIDIPEEEVPVVEELSTTVEELEAKLNEEIQRNVELTSMLSESRKAELTAEICEGLTSTQAAKLKNLAEGVEYTSDEDFVERVATLRENYFPVAVRTDEVLDSVDSHDPQALIEGNLEGPMGRYVQALGRSLPK